MENAPAPDKAFRVGEVVLILLVMVMGTLFYIQQQDLLVAARAEKVAIERGQAETGAAVQGAFDQAAMSSAAQTAAIRELLTQMKSVPSGEGGALPAALVLSSMSDPAIRSSAATILGRLGGDGAENRLLEMAQKDPDNNARGSALQALRGMKSKKVIAIAFDLLKNGDVHERSIAVRAITGVTDPKLVPELVNVLKVLRGADNNVVRMRSEIHQLLLGIGGPGGCRALVFAMGIETDPYRRKTAGRYLARIVSRAELPLLGKTINGLGPAGMKDDPEFWTYLFDGLGRLQDLRATPYLLPHLQSENLRVQRQALEAFRKIRDPLAVPALCAFTSPDKSLLSIRDAILQEKYPGVRKVDGKFAPVPDAEMKVLLEKREKQIKQAEQAIKHADTPDLF